MHTVLLINIYDLPQSIDLSILLLRNKISSCYRVRRGGNMNHILIRIINYCNIGNNYLHWISPPLASPPHDG